MSISYRKFAPSRGKAVYAKMDRNEYDTVGDVIKELILDESFSPYFDTVHPKFGKNRDTHEPQTYNMMLEGLLEKYLSGDDFTVKQLEIVNMILAQVGKFLDNLQIEFVEET